MIVMAGSWGKGHPLPKQFDWRLRVILFLRRKMLSHSRIIKTQNISSCSSFQRFHPSLQNSKFCLLLLQPKKANIFVSRPKPSSFSHFSTQEKLVHSSSETPLSFAGMFMSSMNSKHLAKVLMVLRSNPSERWDNLIHFNLVGNSQESKASYRLVWNLLNRGFLQFFPSTHPMRKYRGGS